MSLNVCFGRVTHTASRAAVIGSGPSLEGIELALSEEIATIAINGAVENVTCRFFFTLDPSPVNRRRLREQRAGVTYYAAVPDDYGSPDAACEDHRAEAEANVIFLRRLTGDGHGRFRTRKGVSLDPGAIHTGNSAWGGLQLALLMGATRIALFGVDGRNDRYAWGEGKPRNLELMPELFASAVPELSRRSIRVVNGSPDSEVDCFLRMRPEKALDWLLS